MPRKSNRAAEQVLLTALAFGATVENAARKAGIGERTAYRRLADPDFRARLSQARQEAVVRTAGMLTGAAVGSVKTLVDLQQDASVPAAVRRGAARDVLENGSIRLPTHAAAPLPFGTGHLSVVMRKREALYAQTTDSPSGILGRAVGRVRAAAPSTPANGPGRHRPPA